MNRMIARLIVITLLFAAGTQAADGKKVTIALNWVPEPEFGGIYEAKRGGAFDRQGVDAHIEPGGAGAPTWQLVASGKVHFAVASADEIVIARGQGADVVGIFVTYQTCPQAIMVHASRGSKRSMMSSKTQAPSRWRSACRTGNSSSRNMASTR